MFEEGRRLGVRGMVATHGMSAPTSLTVEQAQQAARLGAFIEFASGTLATPNAQAEDRSACRRHSQGRHRARHSLVRSRPGGQSAARRRLRDVHGGAAQEGIHRSGARSDGETKSRAAPGTLIRFRRFDHETRCLVRGPQHCRRCRWRGADAVAEPAGLSVRRGWARAVHLCGQRVRRVAHERHRA